MKRVSKTWLFVYLILLVAGSCTQTDVEEMIFRFMPLKKWMPGLS